MTIIAYVIQVVCNEITKCVVKSYCASISGQCGILEPDCELIKCSRWQVEHHAFSSWQHFTYNRITQNRAIAKLISFL